MVRKRPFTIRYDFEVKQHFRAIERKSHALVRTTIDEQLRYEPLVETENRKPLQRPVTFGATWELRLGPNNRFRVYYRVDEEAYAVLILAIGEKKRDKVYIGREEYLL